MAAEMASGCITYLLYDTGLRLLPLYVLCCELLYCTFWDSCHHGKTQASQEERPTLCLAAPNLIDQVVYGQLCGKLNTGIYELCEVDADAEACDVKTDAIKGGSNSIPERE